MNRKIIRIIVSVLIVLEFGLVFLTYMSFSNKNIDEVKETNQVDDNKFAMYVEDSSGDYVEKTENDFPTGAYLLNKEKTVCTDNKNNQVTGVVTYKNGKVTVNSNKTLFCYLYFDLNNDAPVIKTLALGTKEYTNVSSQDLVFTWDDEDVASYCVNTTNSSSSCTWNEVEGNEVDTTYTLSGDGTKTVYVFLKDIANNISASKSDSIVYDTTKPTCKLQVTTSGVSFASKTDANEVTNFGISKSTTATYNNSTAAVALSLGNFYGYVKDAAGNSGKCSATLTSYKTETYYSKTTKTCNATSYTCRTAATKTCKSGYTKCSSSSNCQCYKKTTATPTITTLTNVPNVGHEEACAGYQEISCKTMNNLECTCKKWSCASGYTLSSDRSSCYKYSYVNYTYKCTTGTVSGSYCYLYEQSDCGDWTNYKTNYEWSDTVTAVDSCTTGTAVECNAAGVSYVSSCVQKSSGSCASGTQLNTTYCYSIN